MPNPPQNGFRLRPYQRAACQAAWSTLNSEPATLIVSPTGTGKTAMFGAIAKRATMEQMRTLVLVHGDHLIAQNTRRIRSDWGLEVDVEQAAKHAQRTMGTPTAPVVVASVDSLRQPKRLQLYDPKSFDLIVVDEAHRGISKGFMRVFEHFEKAKRLGVTATPSRSDAKSLLKVFRRVCFEYTTPEAIADGWLVEPRCHLVHVNALDLSKVGSRQGDLVPGELSAAMTVAAQTEAVVPSLEIVGSKSSLMFTVSVNAAHVATEIVRQHGTTAGVIDGTTSKKDRTPILEAFFSDALQILINCAVLVEGFDAPKALALIMARPTQSWGRYMQMLGRGLRPWPDLVDHLETAEARRSAIASSPKPHLLLVDLLDNSRRNDLVRPIDLLKPNVDPRTRQQALRIMEETGETDVEVAIDLAERKMARELAIQMAQDQGTTTVDYKTVIHRFAHQRTPTLQTTLPFYGVSEEGDRWGREASEGQVNGLRKFGIEIGDDERVDKRHAHALLDRLFARADMNLARPKQVRVLLANAVDPEVAMSLTFDQASAEISRLFTKRR